jgi:DNA-binding MarR family transcriptional regulator
VRRAARLITGLYNEELRGHLEAAQFGLLAALDKRPGCACRPAAVIHAQAVSNATQAMLARALGFDKTTASRNLSLMKRKGWIEYTAATDRRERGLHLTSAGRKLVKISIPAWKRAQHRLRSAMTADQWSAMWQAFRGITNAVYQAQKEKGSET